MVDYTAGASGISIGAVYASSAEVQVFLFYM